MKQAVFKLSHQERSSNLLIPTHFYSELEKKKDSEEAGVSEMGAD